MERIVNRRTLLGMTAALSAAGVAAGLSGCGPSASPEENKQAQEKNANAVLPSYVPVELVKPDLASTDLVPAGYFAYPRNPAQAITDKPGAGLDQLSIMYSTLVVPPRDAASNTFWTNLQNGVGTTLNLQPIANGDYAKKFPTVIAGGNLPDIMNFPTTTPDSPKVFEKLFADLGPLLSGDAAKQFPYLANIPQYSWKSTVANGTIYAVPQHRPPTGGGVFYRGDVFDKLGLSPEVSTGDEFVTLMKALSNEKEKRFAFSNVGNVLTLLLAMMGGPNGWSEQNGTFTIKYDHPAFKEAVLKTAELVKAGCAHPDSATVPYDQHRQFFYNETTGLLLDGPAGWDLYVRSLPPDARLGFLIPPKWAGGGDSPQFAGSGIQGITAINKKLTGDKLVAALNVLNYLAAPIGSAEHLQRKYGTEGTDFTWVDNRPELTEAGNRQFMDFQYIVDSPIILGPGAQDEVETQHTFAERVSKSLVYNPTIGLYSPTSNSKSGTIGRPLDDTVTGVLWGRNTPADFDAALKKWHSDGGDQMAEEFGQAFAATPR